MDSHCLVCQSLSIVPILRREQVPVHQNLLFDTPEAAIAVKRGDLDLVLCETCGFIFNRAFDPSLLDYGDHYKNPQEDSPTYARYMSRLVSHLVDRRGIWNKSILEIGCGDGSFLRRLVEEGYSNVGVGWDPSYTGPTRDLDGRLRFETRRYNAATIHGGYDWVVCRHVIEHVDDPLPLLRLIASTLYARYQGRVFLETPTVEWILRHRIFWDFFYEHRSYFSWPSLRVACEIAGMNVVSVATDFDGQYLWVEGTTEFRSLLPVSLAPGDLPDLACAFAGDEPRLLENLRAKVTELASRGGVAIWGAAAKGVTLANLLDPNRSLISCIVDINAQKQSRFLPGTGHPIVAPERLGELRVKAVILTNPIYRHEIAIALKGQGSQIELIDPLEAEA